jgi:hypothetical protein
MAALAVLSLAATTACGTRGPAGDAAARPEPSTAEASASGAPAPSAAPSAAPSKITTTTKPPPRAPAAPAGGKPGPANTGVPAGVSLKVVRGDQTYGTANQVISGLDVHGFVKVTAKNVTIKNSIIRGGAPKCNSAVLWIADGASARIESSEIVAAQPNPCLDGIWATNATLVRLDIRGVVDGVKAHDNVTLLDSYIHDLSWFASDPNQGGGETHNDAVQTYVGNRNILLRHNTLLAGTKGNAAYQVTQDGGRANSNLRVEYNWIDGGGCSLNFSHKGGPTPMTGIYVIGNRFGRGSTFDCPILLSTRTVLSQNTGNVWDDTGRPIPKPQQHD